MKSRLHINPIAFKVPTLANLAVSCDLFTRGDLKFHTHYVAFSYNSVVNRNFIAFRAWRKAYIYKHGKCASYLSFEVYDF